MSNNYMCAECTKLGCQLRDMSKTMAVCPCKDEELQAEAKALYQNEEDLRIAVAAAATEHEGYGRMSRMEEIVVFCKKAGYHKIGIIFCTGLQKEAAMVSKILRHHGMEVVSVCCKNGSMPKSTIGLRNDQCLSGNADEAMCNPISQALVMNKEKVDFSILLGLCVGHDTLAIRHLEGPVTVLAAKDRVTMHNPLAAIYGAEGYYKKRFFGKEEE